MKKTVSLMMFTAMFATTCLMAQIPDGIKYLNYEKNQSAKQAFQKVYDANPKDPQAIYWLGQALLSQHGSEPTAVDIQAAKTLYQKGLADVGSDPWILVGMGHVEILEKGDMNSVKQKFEQAITASTETKGKNKGKPSAAILNAIGHSMAEVASNMGDHAYAVDKLKQAADLDPLNADIEINLGINYLKLGGENGGDAVKAYNEALKRDPKNAYAMYRIGKIYQSQNNKDLFEVNFNNAIAADPAFPLPYDAFYRYYADKDVNKAKEYLDKFVSSADKNPQTDFFLADYLFRAGKYSESIAKAKEIENSTGIQTMPDLYILYALNYDRMGDSVQAKSNLEKYFTNTTPDKIMPAYYDFAVKVFSKFPGNEAQVVGYIDKAIANDTSKVNKMNYMAQAAEMYGKAKMYPQQLEWLQKRIALKGSMSEADHYAVTNAAFNAKDYAKSMELAKAYMSAYPDTRGPYRFYKLSVRGADPDTSKGIALAGMIYMDSMYSVVGKDKYKMEILGNEGFIMSTYGNMLNAMKRNPDLKPPVSLDAPKSELLQQFLAVCQKGIDLSNDIIAAFPDPNDENNKYAVGAKAEFQKNMDYYSKPPAKKSAGSASTPAKGK